MEKRTDNSVTQVASGSSLRRQKSAHARGCAGFSIVELIIVLAILMTVSAIAIPNLKSAISTAKDARAVVEVHNISALVIGYAAGNNGHYPNTLADIDCDKLHDPWGNPYQYLNLTTPASLSMARVDRFNVRINTAFDLYSMGPDGSTTQQITAAESQDDTIYAGDGSFLGQATQY